MLAGIDLHETSLAEKLPEGAACSSPLSCVEPFYCLPQGDDFKCSKKHCAAGDQCSIGQLCKNGLCDSLVCDETNCSANEVCQMSGSCGLKAELGELCSRGDQCLSGRCQKDVCVKGEDGVEVSGSGDNVTESAEDVGDDTLDSGRSITSSVIIGIIIVSIIFLCIMAATYYVCAFAKSNTSVGDNVEIMYIK